MTTPALSCPPDPVRVPAWLGRVLALTAVLAIGGPALVVRTAPSSPRRSRGVETLPVKVASRAELPAIEPVSLRDLTPSDARALNAAVPFVVGVNPAAAPYRFAGADDDRTRAVDCLAAATLYEAGDTVDGERAVAQVVLNRLRHPAFPKTVCGVVFQGSERTTGCQFTFTCDGALVRHAWSAAAWVRAREVANAALSGAVDKPVGYATHYHTDGVVPYWSASLDKVAAVGTHLFFRWTGWWGTAPAFRRHPETAEPVIAQLARLSPAHDGVTVVGHPNDTPAASGPAMPIAATFAPTVDDEDAFLITLPKNLEPSLLPVLARAICGDRAMCKVLGWTDSARTPRTLPLEPVAMNAMAFSYLRDQAATFEKPLWNCAVFPRSAGQCMKRQMIAGQQRHAPAMSSPHEPFRSIAPVSFTLKPIGDALAGVRRKCAPPTATAVETMAAPANRATDPSSHDPRAHD